MTPLEPGLAWLLTLAAVVLLVVIPIAIAFFRKDDE